MTFLLYAIASSYHEYFVLFIVSAAEAYSDRGLICVKNPKASENEPSKDFFFDSVFDANVTQKHIYDVCASGVVESVLNGYNGTIFAYGQVIQLYLKSCVVHTNY